MDKNIFLFIGLLSVSVLLLLLAVSLPNGLLMGIVKIFLLIISLLVDVTAFSSRYYSYMLLPMFKQRRRNIILSNESPYWLSTTSDSIIKKDGDEFVATAYINIPLYMSATEMSDEEKISFSRQVSALVGISSDPVRFTTELYVMNKDSYIEELRDMISNIENEESAMTEKNSSKSELERVKGKLSMWRKMLENVSKGTALELMSFASLSARGSKEYEAVALVQQKARELMSGIGATFGVSPNIVLDKELLKFVEPEFLIPYSTISEQISTNIQEQVI